MNILVTLPTKLIEEIVSGKKQFEMRKRVPKHMKIGEDGFFAVEKGTDNIKCWCRVDEINEYVIDNLSVNYLSRVLCVSPKFVINYAHVGTKVYLWKIGKVIILQDLYRDSLIVDRNPQSYAYCPLSYGESY